METAPFGAVKASIPVAYLHAGGVAAMETAPFGAVKLHDVRYARPRASRNGDRSFRSGEVVGFYRSTFVTLRRNGDRSFRSGEVDPKRAIVLLKPPQWRPLLSER